MKSFAAIPLIAGLLLAPILALADTDAHFDVHNDTSQDLHIVVDSTYACDAPGGQHHGFTCNFDAECSSNMLVNERCTRVNLGGGTHTVTVTGGGQSVSQTFNMEYEPAEEDPDLGWMDATYLASCNVNFFGSKLDVYCG